MIKAVLFDMDGVIIDSEILWVKGVQTLLAKHGVEKKVEELYYVGGGTFADYAACISKELNISLEEAKTIYQNHLVTYHIDYQAILRPSAVKLIQELYQEGYTLAVVSNASVERVKMKLEQCGLTQYFSVISGATLFPQGKPNPAVYHYAMDLCHAKKEECVIIEDSTVGIQGGHNAQIYTIALYDPRFCFDTSLASCVVKDIYEVKNVIQQLNQAL